MLNTSKTLVDSSSALVYSGNVIKTPENQRSFDYKLGTCCSEVKPVETNVSESMKQEFLLTNGRCINDC